MKRKKVASRTQDGWTHLEGILDSFVMIMVLGPELLQLTTWQVAKFLLLYSPGTLNDRV